jgi:hypothetical protein
MSRAALLAAATAPQVFDPTPPPDTLGACLAPYESLIDDCHLHTRLHAYARIALVGPRGCGKTSVARYALDADDVAMILINVVTEEQKDISTVRGFLRILVSQLVNRAETAGKITGSQRQKLLAAAQPTLPLDRKLISYRAALSGGQWLLRGGIARDVTKTIGGGRSYNTTQALREAAAEALEVVGSHGLVPVLVAETPIVSVAWQARPPARCSEASSARFYASSPTTLTVACSSQSTTITSTPTTLTTVTSHMACSKTCGFRSSCNQSNLRRSSHAVPVPHAVLRCS